MNYADIIGGLVTSQYDLYCLYAHAVKGNKTNKAHQIALFVAMTTPIVIKRTSKGYISNRLANNTES